MAKISISAIMARKNKLRIFTIVLCFLLAGVLGQIMISRNPFSAKAAIANTGRDSNGINIWTVTGTQDIAALNTYDNANIVVSAGATLRMSGAGHTFNNLTVDGGTVILAGGPHSFNNITLKNNGLITHDALTITSPTASNDISDKITGALTATGIVKKVNIIVTNVLTLETGGKINVDTKGYPGGYHNGGSGCDYCRGWGPGGGLGGYTGGGWNDTGGVGGSYAGLGGDGNNLSNPRNEAAGTVYGDDNTPYTYGSGGGGARRDTNERNGTGGAGGGIIKIVAGSIILDMSSSITAKGGQGEDDASDGGGGGGGSIDIQTNNLITRTDGSLNPNVSGGIGLNNGGNSNVVWAGVNTERHFGLLSVQGGGATNAGGGGGAGRMRLQIEGTYQSCRIDNADILDSIPAFCESSNTNNIDLNKDVLIDNKTVYADSIPVWQTAGVYPTVCPTASIAENGHTYDYRGTHNGQCRYSYWSWNINDLGYHDIYRSYTINLPYSAGEGCNADPSDYAVINYTRGSAASDCDTKRHFRSLILRNNAKLTHNAVTIAESTANLQGTVTVADDLTGTGRWRKVELAIDVDMFLDLSSNIDASGKGYPGGRLGSCPSKNYPVVNTENGYGPAGGRRSIGGNGSRAAGGAYIGVGGPGNTGITTSYNNPPAFELGSGGGAAYGHDYGGDAPFGSGEDYGCKDGGNGGGRVRITVLGTFNMLNVNSKVLANGESEQNSAAGTGDHQGYASGGGGAAGTIQINAMNFNFVSMPTVTVLYKGGITGGGNGSYTPRSFAIPINLEAVGGNGGGGGGGGRITAIKIVPLSPGIKKKLVAIDRAGSASFNPYGLQKDDKIRVEIEAHNLNLGQVTTVEDEILSTQDPALTISRCIPGTINDPDFASSVIVKEYDNTANPPMVRWKFDPSAETVMLSYECTVQ